MNAALREIVVKHGRVALDPSMGDDTDLFAAGLDSFGMVNVIMAVEETFDVEFSDAALNRRSFSSIASLAAVISAL